MSSRSKKGNAAEALKQLAELKKSGGTRAKLYQPKDVASVYKEVDEKEYANLVRNRGENEFVIDDEGLGYADTGEEEDWTNHYGSDEEVGEEVEEGKKEDKKKKKKKSEKSEPPKVEGQRKINSLFLGAGLGKGQSSLDPSNKRKRADTDDGKSSDDFASMLLSNITSEHLSSADLASFGIGGAKKKRTTAIDPSGTNTIAAAMAIPKPSRPDPNLISSMPVRVKKEAVDPYAAPPPKSIDIPMEDFAPSPPAPSPPLNPPATTPSPPPAAPSPPPAPDVPPPSDIRASPQPPITPQPPTKTVSTSSATPSTVPAAKIPSKPTVVHLTPHPALAAGGLSSTASVEPSSPAIDKDNQVLSSSCNLPIEEDGSFKMYWLDAFEDAQAAPGTVFLIGRVKPKESQGTSKFVSCCVTVKNVPRNLFFLPRTHCRNDPSKEVTSADVFEEVKEVLRQHNVPKFLSNNVERNYAFEIAEVPHTKTNYLKVVYSAAAPALPTDLQGNTFSHVFGTHQSSLELFLLKRKLMGPSWIRIKNPKLDVTGVSWCKVECAVDELKNIEVVTGSGAGADDSSYEVPPLSVLSLTIKTVVNPKTHANEVIMAAGFLCYDVRQDGPTSQADLERKGTKFAVVRKLDNMPLPFDLKATVEQLRVNLEIATNERGLLNFLVAKIHRLDPDVLVGHNLAGLDLDVLLHRMSSHKVAHWAKIGRLKRSSFPKLAGSGGGDGGRYGRDNSLAIRSATAGRLICDTYDCARDLLREKNYTLKTLAESQLNETREDIDPDALPVLISTSSGMLSVVHHTERDALLSLRLMFEMQIVPLTKQLTNIAGNVWARTLKGARAERNEFLLLHEFHHLKYIVPDKLSFREKQNVAANKSKKAAAAVRIKKEEQEDEGGIEEEADDEEDTKAAGSGKGKRKPAYSGGLVLEPKRGLYDKYVLLLDFNSLYPSIIQEFNLCFTTVDRFSSSIKPEHPNIGEGEGAGAGKSGGDGEADALPDLPPPGTQQGVLPRVLRMLVERRRQVKGLIKNETDPHKLQQHDIRQKALKLTANSMYGCLGFQHSRFFAKPIAALITSQGRDILQRTVEIAQNSLNLDVIYGDTDSVMIHTGSTDLADVRAIGNAVKKEVNKLYRCLEIEIDAIFKMMLLLRKKKYAALKVVEKAGGATVYVAEKKGLDMVRRDWCELSSDISQYALNQILRPDASREDVVEKIHAYLRGVAEDLKQERVPLRKFIITKSLSKAPEEYPDAKGQPHVQVALQLKQQGRQLRAGEIIEYVICQDEAKTSFADRAYPPDTVVKAGGALKIDYKWYLSQQIHPPVARLCEPIEGTDAAQIADCLGLDSAKYHASVAAANSRDEEYLSLQMDEEEKYKSVEPLRLICAACKDTLSFAGVYKVLGSGAAAPATVRTTAEFCSGVRSLSCPKCAHPRTQAVLENQVIMAVKSHMDRYYEQYMLCEDPTCSVRHSRQLSVTGACWHNDCRSGRLVEKYSAVGLYRQLQYFEALFDVDQAKTRLVDARKRGDPIAQSVPDNLDLSRLQVDLYNNVKARMARLMDHSAYRFVDLKAIYSFMTATTNRSKAQGKRL